MPKMPKINTDFQNIKSPAWCQAGLLRLVASVVSSMLFTKVGLTKGLRFAQIPNLTFLIYSWAPTLCRQVENNSVALNLGVYAGFFSDASF